MLIDLLVTKPDGETSTMPMHVRKNPAEWDERDVLTVVDEIWDTFQLPATTLAVVTSSDTGFTLVLSGDGGSVQLGPLDIDAEVLRRGLDRKGRQLPDLPPLT